MDYFDSNNYFSDQHSHIGYYFDNLDIEGIGLKRIDGTWDIFVEDSYYLGLFDSKHPRVTPFGAYLFNTTENNIKKEFYIWVKVKLIPFLQLNNSTFPPVNNVQNQDPT